MQVYVLMEEWELIGVFTSRDTAMEWPFVYGGVRRWNDDLEYPEYENQWHPDLTNADVLQLWPRKRDRAFYIHERTVQ